MAQEGLKIIIGADVSQAINNIGKVNTKLQDTDQIVADVIGSSSNLEDALDKLGKQGLVSISILQVAIDGFREGFKNATDPEDIKKFGEGLTALTKKQNELITAGLGVEKQHGSQTVATQRLSSSLLGLNKIFDILPAEIAHSTHGFEQLVQSFERVTHGTEGAGEKITKFAGVLGEVGLGIAISLAVGLLVEFTKELLNSDAALEKAAEEGVRFSSEIDRINTSIEDSKANLKFLSELNDINININFGKGFTADLLKLTGGISDVSNEALVLEKSVEDAGKIASEAFKSLTENASDELRSLVGQFQLKIPAPDVKKLDEADKELLKNAQETRNEFIKIQKELTDNQHDLTLQQARIRELNADKQREDEKKANDELKKLLESRARILEEFSVKFGLIKLPLPLSDLEVKNIPLGKVSDKLLRNFLQQTLSVFDKEFKNLQTGVIDPRTLPVEIIFKPLFQNRTDLVRQIEEQFGEIGKDVESGVNKGIFEVPIDFKSPAEGDGKALKDFEDRVNDFLKQVQSLTGQKFENIRFDISPEFLVKLDEVTKRKVLDDIQHQINISASNVPLKVTGKADVKVEVDADRVAEQLSKELNDAIQSAAVNIFSGIGETIGDAISKGLSADSLKGVLSAITDLLASVGKALVSAGVKMLGLQKAIDALKLNPAVSIAFGIALIALSKALANNIQGAREKGGPVQQGMSYLVNERGKEIFVPNNGGSPAWIEGGAQLFKPNVSGKIVPAWQAKMFASKFQLPAFADGGLVTGPVFGLLGEGTGISSINPEVIAPLETLKNLLPLGGGQSIDVRVIGSLSNRIIKLGQAREGKSNRRTG